MNFELGQERRLIREQIRELCADFGDDYWREKNRNHEFAWEFFDTFADDGWCGITIPQEYGGQGYGVQEAALVQQEIARSGAAMAGTSITSHHVFSTAPLVEFGDEEHKRRYLPKIADGDVMVCTGVTEPNAGTDTSRIETFAERDGDEYVVNGQKIWTSKAQEADVIMLLARTAPREESDRFGGLSLFFTEFDRDMDGVEVSEIPKAGRGAADSNEVWFDDVRVPAADRIGEEGDGFSYLLSFANSERISIAANAVGIGQAAVEKASDYAREREVFDSAIGSYQAIQHPLADAWSKLELDELAVRKAAWLYDNDEDAGAAANAAKLRASEDALEACERAMRVHGGMGYAQEYDVERYWRETMINVIAPISNEMVKNYIGQHVLDLPRSY
ncbi:acyl-CoA dehydrogenase family protein [Halorientalis regularis]|jgi:acyl-CoA dehydrogenase|uniref:Acyl-CoA dehydrogenase n=1 Tax=Halorientalis regularis TaxID=660518 RepID=A0A1G7N7T0_9EURY|nr:acyl-CoA dehydrogenase family protein [Halorientalis regularis]SDF70125.1 acyl-CoA dehydrogenase [Halorientalis regularis]